MHAGRYGQQVGGTHPTGMHSCLALFLRKMHENEIFKSANDVDLYPKVSDSVSSCRLDPHVSRSRSRSRSFSTSF